MEDYVALILNPVVSRIGCASMAEICHVKVWDCVQEITHVETLDVDTICLLNFSEDPRRVERNYGHVGSQCPKESEDGLCLPMEQGTCKH
ncbi:hypothetical protein GCK72_012208 [Caenorhabditis remanei]|uniref:Uncharacterized protein n=1 Tax=Caenorhabditis remanei TaxID=31234 RepID=A0A6A5GKD1_CAERE|nr:hypothetical protein GCK72_012208 [Caenorhabditis remanei]KAF1755758.1 hypothetical protein GCK72_012208 [Caenorhabditis remanei]